MGSAKLPREIGTKLGVLAEEVDRVDDHFSAFRWLLPQASALRHVRDQNIRFWPKLLRVHVGELVAVDGSGCYHPGGSRRPQVHGVQRVDRVHLSLVDVLTQRGSVCCTWEPSGPVGNLPGKGWEQEAWRRRNPTPSPPCRRTVPKSTIRR